MIKDQTPSLEEVIRRAREAGLPSDEQNSEPLDPEEEERIYEMLRQKEQRQ